ncbi:MAG: hypothetical protein OK438_05825 [Thaumarchaeota archaeon]|nr:hypothetical protein [Nitrososphaerota archaeon]
MSDTRTLAVIPVFAALIVGSDLVLAGIPNVKLVDTLVFVSAYVYGFRVGASVGILSEFLWAYLSPWGMPGYIAPFLIAGEVVYALAGFLAAKFWKGSPGVPSGKSIFIGSILVLCAFFWDLETNLATALVQFWPTVTLAHVAATLVSGIPFMLSHEVSDFMFGMVFAPVIILLIPRLMARTQRIGFGTIRAEESK